MSSLAAAPTAAALSVSSLIARTPEVDKVGAINLRVFDHEAGVCRGPIVVRGMRGCVAREGGIANVHVTANVRYSASARARRVLVQLHVAELQLSPDDCDRRPSRIAHPAPDEQILQRERPRSPDPEQSTERVAVNRAPLIRSVVVRVRAPALANDRQMARHTPSFGGHHRQSRPVHRYVRVQLYETHLQICHCCRKVRSSGCEQLHRVQVRCWILACNLDTNTDEEETAQGCTGIRHRFDECLLPSSGSTSPKNLCGEL
mmetsp:Transcript_5462/g.18814  ORF Transcript_5462/g.18814 Transcript_5462/m.18814 type:complete len:260 (-) Transcript_5462:2077-2856(-)